MHLASRLTKRNTFLEMRLMFQKKYFLPFNSYFTKKKWGCQDICQKKQICYWFLLESYVPISGKNANVRITEKILIVAIESAHWRIKSLFKNGQKMLDK